MLVLSFFFSKVFQTVFMDSSWQLFLKCLNSSMTCAQKILTSFVNTKSQLYWVLPMVRSSCFPTPFPQRPVLSCINNELPDTNASLPEGPKKTQYLVFAGSGRHRLKSINCMIVSGKCLISMCNICVSCI